MTFREKLQQDHPERVNKKYHGGCFGCPSTFGYENRDIEENNCPPAHAFKSYSGMNRTIEKHCRACWDREYKDKENG